MKALFAAVFVTGFSLFAATASASPDWDGSRRPGWGGDRCVVSFQKCDFALGGNCLKWNNKTFPIRHHEARWACRRAEQEYGRVRHCRVSCR